MSIGLKIKEVADASGFTAATLRYYEQIGLLPEVSRTPAGFALFAIFAVLVGAAVTVFVLDDLATMLRSWTPHVTVVASDAAAFPSDARVSSRSGRNDQGSPLDRHAAPMSVRVEPEG